MISLAGLCRHRVFQVLTTGSHHEGTKDMKKKLNEPQIGVDFR